MPKPVSHTRIALERINELFKQAEDNWQNHGLSKRYVVLARKMATRFRVRFTREQKKSFCKRCDTYLKQGHNSTIRLVKNRMVLTCKECGFVRRFVYKK